jgi:acyl dehydratase
MTLPPQDSESVPYRERYFEDYRSGEVVEFGDHLITEEEVVGFAQRYDPQPFHVDAVAAQESIYGGLIASGWMTASVAMRLLVDHYISPRSSMGSPGIDEMRWIKPVRPGNRLRLRVTILETRRSQSKPDRGMIQLLQEMQNQDNETVMTIRGWGMYRCRDAG